MHPAKSVIILTVSTGAGYGLAILLALLKLAGLPIGGTAGIIALTLALVLVTVGLIASTLHLGHPERAWRAMSQWRTSWLSREGLLAVLTYIPMGLWWLTWVTGIAAGTAPLWQCLAIIGGLATLYAQSKIYASLKAVHAWHNRLVTPGFYLFSLATGAVLLAALLALAGNDHALPSAAGSAIVLLSLSLFLKLAYWRSIDEGASVSTPETATGLGHLGKVKLVEGPHTQANYLMREMGFQVARKHATRLRQIALIAGFIVPAMLLGLCFIVGIWIAGLLSVLAALCCGVGIVCERWLFFAQARHTVMLYYGAEAA